MLGAEVDLVLGAVQPEPDGAVSLAAVNVNNEQCLHALSHVPASFSP
jgi:hypothetical protein